MIRRYALPADALTIVFAFALCAGAGNRGLYPFDQSIVFDGAYRLLQGQFPC